MDQNMFRKASLERIESPDQLNTYIKVAHVNVWLVLIGILLLLAGFLAWGIFGRITTELPVPVMVTEGRGVFFLSQEDARRAGEDMTITVEGTTASVSFVSAEAVQLGQDAFLLPGLEPGKPCYWGNFSISVPDGIYEGVLTVESIHPITLILH